MEALEQARLEAQHYKTLFVVAVAYYGQMAPPMEQDAVREAIVAAMDAIEHDWMTRYGDAVEMPAVLIAELKRIGGIDE